VLVVLRDEGDLGPAALFTKRPDTLKAHPGQISFPGGSIGEGESVVDAALREAEEEVGLPRDAVETLGLLHDIDTSTGFVLTPVVARQTREVELRLCAAEVTRAFTAPLRTLAARLELKPMSHAGREWQVPHFAWDGETIWGATGRVLVDLMKVMELLP
jgi:8-oxo-dGTP pyrophosphatase MutT (NUDIX family)